VAELRPSYLGGGVISMVGGLSPQAHLVLAPGCARNVAFSRFQVVWVRNLNKTCSGPTRSTKGWSQWALGHGVRHPCLELLWGPQRDKGWKPLVYITWVKSGQSNLTKAPHLVVFPMSPRNYTLSRTLIRPAGFVHPTSVTIFIVTCYTVMESIATACTPCTLWHAA